MVEFAKDRLYQETHEWVKIEGKMATCGISDFAQEELNDIVYVELPEVGDSFEQGDAFAVVESVKAASDIYMPMSGKIVEINEELADSPQLVNESPFEEGWLVKIRISAPEEADSLLDAAAYKESCEEGA
jgi:glycine cleavage system H protein